MHRAARRILLIATAFALFVVPAADIPAAGFADVADDSASDADTLDSLDSTVMISTAASAARSRSLVIPHFAPSDAGPQWSMAYSDAAAGLWR